VESAPTLSAPPDQQRAWRLAWLTPLRCRIILAALLLLGFLGHLRYLTHDCPIDLSGDEAHYWDWSRRLDISYYSKGPMVAWLIRASCALFGDNMPAVRLPALILAVGSTILTYWLTLRLFKSDRLALGAVLLNHLVPMFVAGSVLMTIDPPFFFCWGLATCFAVKAIFDNKKWAWIAMGIAIGLGFWAKFTMLYWLVGLLIFLSFDRQSRRLLRSPWPWLATLIALLFAIPTLIWIHRHNYVTFRHIVKDSGEGGKAGFNPMNFAEFIGGQIGAVGPTMAAILIGAILFALRRRRENSPQSRAMNYLLAASLPLIAVIALLSFVTKAQVNWPANSYFALLILAAYFLFTRMANHAAWRRWRGIFWITVVFGILCTPIAHNTQLLYQPVNKVGQMLGRKKISPRQWDPTFRLRGWREFGIVISDYLTTLRPGAIVMCEDYQTTAEAAFYVTGQPKTYYVGSWLQQPARLTQYDLWPDRRLDNPDLLGRDAIYYGHDGVAGSGLPPDDLVAAFDSVERLADLKIFREGLEIRDFRLWRCKGFKGMHRAAHLKKF
jgi:4-amino-4-deoxy-L-arabinose transferase-like glycosyltransferase